jgi:UDP-N-acetylglucosamine/UDP-N-acetylgalactosamine diphosphorylase
MMHYDELKTVLTRRGQEHVLAFWNQLDAAARERLGNQIAQLDLDLLEQLYQRRSDKSDFGALAARAGSPPAFRLNESENRFSIAQSRECGQQALGNGEVGVVLVAGGQGTRLGFDHPKGMFPIGPVSGRTLFQIHVEKIVAAARRYGVSIPLYLMTSPATHAETSEFFAAHERFGLPAEDLMVFCQGTMPAVDAQSGRLLLESPDRLALSPDGHGGMLAAMERHGILADIERRGLRHLFYFQVDNPLVDIAGPLYLGYHILSQSEMTSQVVPKHDPAERVGNVVLVDRRLMVIEYSDLPDADARRRNADGSLAIWAGSIAVHVFDAAFLRRMVGRLGEALPFHIANKKVAYIGADGRRVQPAEPNAIKFERFIFDLMPSARNAIVVEVDAAHAFAPLKNAPGAKDDTPEAVQAAILAQHRGWLREAGFEVPDGARVEISPLLALDAEELAARLPRGTCVAGDTYLK